MTAGHGVATRRPIATRGAGWAKALARGLARLRVAPNAISVTSLFFAAGAGGSLVLWSGRGVGRAPGWLLLAAAGIQLRLLANLLDGMVAVEGGLASKNGGSL